jgi:Flp pilus assembly protein TadD
VGWALAGGLLLAICAVYANHFHNSFHFDDSHTISQNPAIRRLGNIPSFFTDARTFSVLPTHQSYHPLLTASLALDYWMAGGLNPLWFHISTFVAYLAQLALMYVLFVRIMNLSRRGWDNRIAALLAVGLYGLHPVSAETVNYVIQRADLYVALGIVAGLAAYAYWPRGRKFGLYLLPVIAAGLVKAVALVFPAMLFCYVLLFQGARLRRAVRACMPALGVCAGLGVLQAAMTPATFFPGAASRAQYWLTQPIVAFHYFKSFFLPTELSADTDRQLVTSVLSEAALIGWVFLAAVGFAIHWSLRSRERRPIAFGLLWFLIALLPTSLFPLAEVENDHRMFLPFVGLTLAVTWSVALVLMRFREHWADNGSRRAALVACGVLVFAGYGYGAHLRNQVWHTEESLWKDVVKKSPRNGRGLMNYGLTLMAKGDLAGAYDHFQRASFHTPNYSTLEINLGIASAALKRDEEAERHFWRAITLSSEDAQPYFFFGRYLNERGRIPEAVQSLSRSAGLNAAYLDPRYLLMRLYAAQANWVELERVAGEIARVVPGDAEARRYSTMVRDAKARIAEVERLANAQPTPENHLNLSQNYCQTGRYDDCVRAAREALRLRPGYAEAYNNIAAGYQSMRRWDDAIAAAQEAVRLKPDFQLARNNLAYAISQKNQGSASR